MHVGVTSLLGKTYSFALKSDCLFYRLNMKVSSCMSHFMGTSVYSLNDEFHSK